MFYMKFSTKEKGKILPKNIQKTVNRLVKCYLNQTKIYKKIKKICFQHCFLTTFSAFCSFSDQFFNHFYLFFLFANDCHLQYTINDNRIYSYLFLAGLVPIKNKSYYQIPFINNPQCAHLSIGSSYIFSGNKTVTI
nr:MAG TPA: hypothetical protein [Caudoviricetes sp.]